MHNVTLLVFVGLAFDTDIILEDELEDGRRTSLDKNDRYFYETISKLLRNCDRPYSPFKRIYLCVRVVSLLLEECSKKDLQLTDLDPNDQPVPIDRPSKIGFDLHLL
jgi:hypothetical protein